MIRFGWIIGFFCLSFFGIAQQNETYERIAQRFGRLWNTVPQEKVYLHTDKYLYSAGETIWLKAYMVHASNHRPLQQSKFVYVELLDSASIVKQRLKIQRTKAGAYGSMKLPADYKPGEYTLRAYTYWMLNAGREFLFHKKIRLGNLIDTRPEEPTKEKQKRKPAQVKDDFDLQFFPESGHLLTGDFQSIAFKAVGNDGLSLSVSGAVYNQQNEEVATFVTGHRGMGKLILSPRINERYYALVRDENGREKQVDLPTPEAVGVALQLTYNRGKINLKITNNTSLPADSLYLMVHSRGEVMLLSPLNNYTGQLSEHLLPAGIISFSILDASERVWCERIYFSRTFADPTINMIADCSEYISREPVQLSFLIQKPDSTPLPANFSLSVTDSYHVQKDTLNNDIRSYLLLSSDLKGYVEAPQEYFADNSLQTREKTDLLMLTQGWRRFNTADIVKGNYPKNEYFLEAGQALTGKVLNLFNKPVRNSTVVSMNRYDNKVKLTTTDSLGRFYIDGIEFPDSTSITLKATTRSKIADVEIVPDSDFFPTPPSHLPKQLVNKESLSDEYLRVSREKYYNDGGMMVINLDEITVSASSVKKEDGRDFYYSGMADSEINAERLAKFPTMRLIDVLATVPGVMVFGDNIRIRGSMEAPTLMIDGMEAIDSSEIMYLNAADVEEVQVFKGSSAAIFGVRGANGVIAITLKKGITPNRISSPSIAHIKPLGFHVPDAFYVPRYEVDSIRQQKKVDLRTTIYWNPDVETDADGRAVVTFYTADNPNNYRVEMEGIAADGSICRYRGELKRR